MKKRDISSLIITFTLGAAVGAYLYMYGFMPKYGEIGDFADEAGDLVIVAREYGSCTASATCESFKLAEDAKYRLLMPTGKEGESPEVVDGEVTNAVFKKLTHTLSKTNLTKLAEPVTPTDCDSFNNQGVDYAYEVTLSGETYSLDTCTTALATNDAVREVFASLHNEI